MEEPFWMGCYGIGISRLAQASIEQSQDESGIIWPKEVAPFKFNLINLGVGEKLYDFEKLCSRIY